MIRHKRSEWERSWGAARKATPSIQSILQKLGIGHTPSHRLSESLPFSLNDVTAGTENELQVAVRGERDTVDLPLTIAGSSTFSHLMRRASAGDTSRQVVSHLERTLSQNREKVWENSWVRFPLRLLTPLARQVLDTDLLADKRDPQMGQRSDLDRFLLHEDGEHILRIPISYLLKLSLADAVGAQEDLPPRMREVGLRLMAHFLNDNTSPETYSFHPVGLHPHRGMGRAIARETSKRFLLTQLLVQYANERFELRSNGQEVLVYFAPHPPIRQKELNDSISDAFYRELFMSPCLSGWDRGEEKHRYMGLCHQVLSRSQLNAIAKLREAGIITRNLVVLPNLSNISLANNGTHLSLGSRKLTLALQDGSSGFTRADEKTLGDLIIKVVEHFLPLFVGSYSAAPYRMDFSDFHPEKALGFLPHELDYTHLRMIWRRWKKKASLRVLGCAVTPFGPEWLDRALAWVLNLKGDLVPDFRLIDYFVALMSTEGSPALDGRLGNGDRLKAELTELGVFDSRMALYMLYRLREQHQVGFSGFEGRYYSLFHSLLDDLGHGASLQVLVTGFALKLIAEGRVSLGDIPDDPSVESERRQIFFGGAIGIPTFYVRQDTGNRFLRQVIQGTDRVRLSRRYPGYLRVYHAEYRKALAQLLLREADDLVGLLDLGSTLQDLLERLSHPGEAGAGGKLERGILEELGARSPMRARAREFNAAAERYYRGTLRKRHTAEAMVVLEEDLKAMDGAYDLDEEAYRPLFADVCGEVPATEFLSRIRKRAADESLTSDEILKLIDLVLITVARDLEKESSTYHEIPASPPDGAPVCRTANR
ncbi:MAG: hypothetical protein MUF52_03435 [Syntrophobacteraceae bacterium]|jgi:hypothetical protein|nr:hypothetical protein [Syntrophobacteraceae bacterium]